MYCGGRLTPLGPLIKKNWLPLVLGPALAMASEPIWYCCFDRLVVEAVARAATAGAGRVAALAHEAVDDAVEDHAVVVVVSGEEDEVVDRVRRVDRVERDDDVPMLVSIVAV